MGLSLSAVFLVMLAAVNVLMHFFILKPIQRITALAHDLSAGKLDPSGLVKGWAVDKAADILSAAGARAFSINASGDIVLRGRPAPEELWRIGIQHPLERDRLAASHR